MAPQQASGTNSGGTNGGMTATTRRRRGTRAGRMAGTRAGAATGGGNTGNAQLATSLTPEQRKFYALGQRHACEVHGIPWSGGIAGR